MSAVSTCDRSEGKERNDRVVERRAKVREHTLTCVASRLRINEAGKSLEHESTVMKTGEVVVFVQLRIQPEHREEFLETLVEIIERSRIARACLSYELFSRADDENSLFIFQTWGTREAFETNWLYIDLPRLHTNSHLLAGPIESWELQLLL